MCPFSIMAAPGIKAARPSSCHFWRLRGAAVSGAPCVLGTRMLQMHDWHVVCLGTVINGHWQA